MNTIPKAMELFNNIFTENQTSKKQFTLSMLIPSQFLNDNKEMYDEF